MRVLYVSRTCGLHDRRFLRKFVSSGVQTGFIGLQNATDAPAQVRICGVLGLSAEATTAQLLSAQPSLSQFVRDFDPTVIVSGPVHDGGFVVTTSGLDVPCVIQSWAMDVFWEARHDAEVQHRSGAALRAADGLLADCAAVVERCEHLAAQPAKSFHVMPWGVDIDQLRLPRNRDRIRNDIGAVDREVVLCIRGMEPIYGVDTALKAFLAIHAHNPRALLVWAADGSMRAVVDEFVQDNKLDAAVLLLGVVDHDGILDLMAAADCYVSCSFCDGTSVSLLEAMHSGLPIVAANVGGTSEWIRNEETGFVVDGADPVRFAQAIAKALSLTQAQRRTMATKNRAVVETRADWNRNFPRYLEYLSAVAASRARMRP